MDNLKKIEYDIEEHNTGWIIYYQQRLNFEIGDLRLFATAESHSNSEWKLKDIVFRFTCT